MDENNNRINDDEINETVNDNENTVSFLPVDESLVETEIIDDSSEVEETDSNDTASESSEDVPLIQPTNTQYSPVPEKKFKIVPILAGVIAVLLVGIGVLGGILLTKNNKDKSNDTNVDNNHTTTETTTTTELPMTSTSIVETTTDATEESLELPDQYTPDEVSAMYSAYISENPDPNHKYDDPKYGYYLIDLNEDGKQELLITTEEVEAGSPGVVAAYAINNKNLTQLWITDSRFIGYLCEGNIINSFTAMGQGNGTALYQYKSGDKLDLIDIISFDYSSGSEVIYHNQEVISKADADAILAQYKKMKFEAKLLKISSVSEPQTEPTTSASPKETYIFFGVVSTESGTLNLRDKPSTDSNVIAQLEKGTKGDIFSIEGIPDWYRIITSDGKKGYVSAQYIKEYDHTNTQQNDNNISNGNNSYTTPTEVDISLNKNTPIEFSKYDGDTLISTIRLDKVEYDLKLYDPYKHSDTDYDRYYIDLRFYFTKTYDRYANDQRYSTNPRVYFNIKDLTDGTIWYSSSYKDYNIIAEITPYGINREGDTKYYSWSSKKETYSKSLVLNSTHQYVINIMNDDEAYAK